MSPAATVETLKLIGELELALAEFYAAAAACRAADPAFWLGLEQEERRHAAHIEQMIAMIEANPTLYQTNRGFNPAAIQTFSAYVRDATSRLKKGEVPPNDEKYLLSLARDMEQSVIEAKFSEIVKTSDLEFQALMRHIVSETQAHKNKIVGRLAGRPAR